MGKPSKSKVQAISCECGMDGKCRNRLVSLFGNTVINMDDKEKVETFKATCNEYDKFITGIPVSQE